MKIPLIVLETFADAISSIETHASLTNLFKYHAPISLVDTNDNKYVRTLNFLRQINNLNSPNKLSILGGLIESYMENIDPELTYINEWKAKLNKVLTHYNLIYKGNGVIETKNSNSISNNLEKLIRDIDTQSISEEFERALSNIEKKPKDSLSAASNIIESICKVYISEENLPMPQKQDFRTLWNIVRKDLKLDTSNLEDQDLHRIISGIISVADGISALRTHASSAHGAGKVTYKLESRHIRLAVNSAFTLATFILESWKKNKAKK